MTGKAFFIDTTLCTACRGCQVACKQWNQLPATETKNRGSHQNPKDLSFYTYKVVRFQEHVGEEGKPVWYFYPDQCRHCLEPPCLEVAEDTAPGGVIIDGATGAVLYTDKLKKADARDVIDACPFNVPRVQEGTGILAKCTMCVDRVHNGLLPACVKTCPTGAMNFGERDRMIALAMSRLEQVKSRYSRAVLTGVDDLRCIHLLADEPARYHVYADAGRVPVAMDRKTALRKIGRSLKELNRESSLFKRWIG